MARFVFADALDEVLLAAEPVLAAHNRRYVQGIAAWLADRDLVRGRPTDEGAPVGVLPRRIHDPRCLVG
jgi:hypothetical protein